MKEPKPYEIADAAIRRLNRRVVQLFARAKDNMLIAGFDELNVVSECNTLYASLEKSARKEYIQLFALRYLEMMEWLKSISEKHIAIPGESAIDDLAEAIIFGLLSEPNPLTHYSFDAEILRKRDKAIEAINSVNGKGNKQNQLNRHRRYIAAQLSFYSDFSSQAASTQALKSANVGKVQRHEMNDSKTCSVCRSLDGKIYDVNNIPPPEHLHCRAWYTPV